MYAVPICTAAAPRAKAAPMPRASAIPPAAITGTLTASTTCGTSAIVPTCVKNIPLCVWETEMEADDLRVELQNEIAHFVVEGSAVGAQNSSAVIEPHLDVIGLQTSSPVHFASRVAARLLVTEEIHIDWARCLSADGFQLSVRLFHTQQRTSKR